MYLLLDSDGNILIDSPYPFENLPEGTSVAEVADDGMPTADTEVLANEWAYVGGEFIRHAPFDMTLVPGHEPLSAQEVIKAVFAASPALTVGLVDSLAARMADYLPEWDAGTTYTLGCLAIKDGKVCRRTVGGAWREVA